MISVIAKIPIKEGKVEEAIQAFKELMVQVAEEEGTLMYTLNRDQSNPNTLVIMERYKDKAAWMRTLYAPFQSIFCQKSRVYR